MYLARHRLSTLAIGSCATYHSAMLDTQAPPRLDSMLCFAVHAAGFALTRAYRRPLQRLGVTYPQYLVLVALWEEDGVTVGRLGERLWLDSNTLTPLLKRLETLGLLTRRRSEADERRVIVALTDEGRAMQHQAAEVTRCIAQAANMPPEAMARLKQELRVLSGNLRAAEAE